MANLTEKETRVEHDDITAKILVEYHNGHPDKVIASIEVEGHVVSWSLNHHHGEITLWDQFAGGFTSDWKIAVILLDKDFMLKLRKEIDKLTETR